MILSSDIICASKMSRLKLFYECEIRNVQCRVDQESIYLHKLVEGSMYGTITLSIEYMLGALDKRIHQV